MAADFAAKGDMAATWWRGIICKNNRNPAWHATENRNLF
jgi:hypothetical protein